MQLGDSSVDQLTGPFSGDAEIGADLREGSFVAAVAPMLALIRAVAARG